MTLLSSKPHQTCVLLLRLHVHVSGLMNVVKLLSPLEPTLELDPSTCTDLPMLLGGDSPLIQALACSSDYTASLKCLRLVSKEVGRLALLGLREYTLSLQGNGDDTNVNAASLLQHAKLSKLTVHLRLTGDYSPHCFNPYTLLELIHVQVLCLSPRVLFRQSTGQNEDIVALGQNSVPFIFLSPTVACVLSVSPQEVYVCLQLCYGVETRSPIIVRD